MYSVSESEQLIDEAEECETCGKPMGEFGQEHECECGEDITGEQCENGNGVCERCAWKQR